MWTFHTTFFSSFFFFFLLLFVLHHRNGNQNQTLAAVTSTSARQLAPPLQLLVSPQPREMSSSSSATSTPRPVASPTPSHSSAPGPAPSSSPKLHSRSYRALWHLRNPEIADFAYAREDDQMATQTTSVGWSTTASRQTLPASDRLATHASCGSCATRFTLK